MKRYLLFLLINFILLLDLWRLFFPASEPQELFTYRFTFVSPWVWDQVGAGIASADAELGTDTRCVGLRNGGPADQAEAIRKAIYAQVTGIITIFHAQDSSLTEALRDAAQAGIPVLLIDSDDPDSGRVGTVGPNNSLVGRQAARAVSPYLSGSSRIGVLVGSLEDPGQAGRLEAFRENRDIAWILEDGGDTLQAKAGLQRMLQQDSDIDALFCASETSTQIVGDVLEDMGYSPGRIPVVGFGMSEKIHLFLQRGWLKASIVPDRFEEGMQAVKSLQSYISHDPDFQEDFHIQTTVAGPDFDYEGWLSSEREAEVSWDLS